MAKRPFRAEIYVTRIEKLPSVRVQFGLQIMVLSSQKRVSKTFLPGRIHLGNLVYMKEILKREASEGQKDERRKQTRRKIKEG